MNTLNQQSGNQKQANTAPFAPREISKPDVINYNRLSDLELLSKLIGVREAKKIYSTGGSLQTVFGNKADAPEEIQVARELLTRFLHEEMKDGDAMNSPQAVKDFLTLHFAGQQYESFVAIFLDAQHRVIKASELFRGTLTQTSVYPREIVKAALKHNCAAVIFAHNHPSGVCEPSQSDRMLTDALKQALALVDVRVLDHIIAAGNKTLSFAERGLI
jgi:DNA repair protein RadC